MLLHSLLFFNNLHFLFLHFSHFYPLFLFKKNSLFLLFYFPPHLFFVQNIHLTSLSLYFLPLFFQNFHSIFILFHHFLHLLFYLLIFQYFHLFSFPLLFPHFPLIFLYHHFNFLLFYFLLLLLIIIHSLNFNFLILINYFLLS